jgi:predicted MFS family arabinose efflux permease
MHTADTAPTTAPKPHTDPHATLRGDPEPDTGPRKSWGILALALTAQILVVLDISVVNTALPAIGESLRLGSGDLQWVVTAYLLLSGGGLLLGGRIADLLPRRRVFLAGMTIFTSASLFSGRASASPRGRPCSSRCGT